MYPSRSLPPAEARPSAAPDIPNGPPAAAESGLSAWQARKAELLSALVRLEGLARDRSDEEVAGDLRLARNRLEQGRLTLAVLGEFKRGKSTLVNALLGEEVMPVGVIPMTSVALRVEYGEMPRAEVEFQDGRRLEVDLTEVYQYATEGANPGNHKAVGSVAIRHPAPILAQGVILLDTPGIGSTHLHNTAAAYDQLRQADAAVFVLSVDTPASQAELEFLAAAQQRVSRVLFVLNKADLLNPEELEQATRFVRSVLEGAAGPSPVQLWPISARLHDAGYLAFVSGLEHFLMEERGRFLLDRAKAVCLFAARLESRAVALERAALNLSAEEAERRSSEIEDRLADIRRQRIEAEEILSADVRRLVEEHLEPSVTRFRKIGMERMTEVVQATVDAARPDLRGRLDDQLVSATRELVSAWTGELQQEVEAALAEVAERHNKRTNGLLQAAIRAVEEVFQLDRTELNLTPELAATSQRLVLVEDQLLALEVLSTGLKRMAPGKLGVRLARRDALRRADELIDRHCGRIHHDVVERLRAREGAWKAELRGRLNHLEASVAQAAEVARSARAEGGGAVLAGLRRLEERQLAIEDLEAHLGAAVRPAPCPAVPVVQRR